MSTLSQLLERLRRVRLPPGAAAGVVAIPSAEDGLSGEVAFLFGQLDEVEQRGGRLVSSARSDAAEAEAAAGRERRRLLDDAGAESERLAAVLITERRAQCNQQAQAMIAGAESEAERVLARGRERTPALVAEVVARILETAA